MPRAPRTVDTLELAVAGRIARVRRARGITQAQLAERIGVTVETMSRYEQARQSVSLLVLSRIAAALRIRLGILIEDDDGPTPEALLLIDEWGRLPGRKQALVMELVAALQAAPQTENVPEEGDNSEVVRDPTDETSP